MSIVTAAISFLYKMKFTVDDDQCCLEGFSLYQGNIGNNMFTARCNETDMFTGNNRSLIGTCLL